MELEDVKKMIKVDFDDDDDYIDLLIDVAKAYIKDSVCNGDGAEYDDSNPRHRLLLVALVDAMYKERSYTVPKNEKISYIVRSINAQLRDGW